MLKNTLKQDFINRSSWLNFKASTIYPLNIKNKSYTQLINTAKRELLDSGFVSCLEYPDWMEHIINSEKLIKETQKIVIEKSKNKFLDKTETDVKKFWEEKGGK